METIKRDLEGAPLPSHRVCDHLVCYEGDMSLMKQCANCHARICSDCEDDAVICHSCDRSICEECQETARFRVCKPYDVGGGLKALPIREYLCSPCCVRQDAARVDLQLALRATREWMPIETAPKQRLILGFAIVDSSTGNWRMRIISHNAHIESRREEWNGWGDSWIPPTHWMPLPKEPPHLPVWLDELIDPVEAALDRAKEAL